MDATDAGEIKSNIENSKNEELDESRIVVEMNPRGEAEMELDDKPPSQIGDGSDVNSSTEGRVSEVKESLIQQSEVQVPESITQSTENTDTCTATAKTEQEQNVTQDMVTDKSEDDTVIHHPTDQEHKEIRESAESQEDGSDGTVTKPGNDQTTDSLVEVEEKNTEGNKPDDILISDPVNISVQQDHSLSEVTDSVPPEKPRTEEHKRIESVEDVQVKEDAPMDVSQETEVPAVSTEEKDEIKTQEDVQAEQVLTENKDTDCESIISVERSEVKSTEESVETVCKLDSGKDEQNPDSTNSDEMKSIVEISIDTGESEVIQNDKVQNVDVNRENSKHELPKAEIAKDSKGDIPVSVCPAEDVTQATHDDNSGKALDVICSESSAIDTSEKISLAESTEKDSANLVSDKAVEGEELESRMVSETSSTCVEDNKSEVTDTLLLDDKEDKHDKEESITVTHHEVSSHEKEDKLSVSERDEGEEKENSEEHQSVKEKADDRNESVDPVAISTATHTDNKKEEDNDTRGTQQTETNASVSMDTSAEHMEEKKEDIQELTTGSNEEMESPSLPGGEVTDDKVKLTQQDTLLLSENENEAVQQITEQTVNEGSKDNENLISDKLSVEKEEYSESVALYRSESSGFEVKIEDVMLDKALDCEETSCKGTDAPSDHAQSETNKEVAENKLLNNVIEQMEVDATPSPDPDSEMSETPGPATPASTFSMADSVSLEPPTPASSVTDNASAGPTPAKRSRLGSNSSNANDLESHKFPASKLFEYQWPADGSGEYFMLQEQLSEFLGVKSFKRKYPDLLRRAVEIKERVFLLERGAVTETQADLGLTALRSDEVCDLMHKDYPDKYQEYANVLHERQKQTISEKHKEYEVPKFEKSKMTQYIKKARKSASDWNSHILKERREERRAYLDLQTFNIHYPMGKFKKLPPEATKINPYPVALIPGQFQEYHKKYSSNELRYFPLNTAVFNPPKRMWNTLANPQEQQEMETASEDEENASGSDSDSDDNNSSSGSEGSSTAETPQEKSDEKGDKKEVLTAVEENCRICSQGKSSEVKGLEDLVQCSECKKLGHPGCLDLTGEMVTVIKTYPWQCMDCKTCVECMDPYDEDKMMFCDHCDRGYHTFCVGLRSIPNGRWKCRSCKGPETPKTPRSASKNKGKGRGRGRTPAQPVAAEN